jgi:hypothetical protein
MVITTQTKKRTTDMNYRITAAPVETEALNNDGSVTLARCYSKDSAYAEVQKLAKRWFFAGYPEVTIERCVEGVWVQHQTFTLSL